MRHLLAFLICALALTSVSAQVTSSSSFPFADASLTIDERVEDLIARLSTEEKIAQLLYDAPTIKRLGIPAYNWWSECLHGIARNGKATIFPQAIGLGATWDTDLIERIAQSIALEGRAKFNANAEAGYMAQYAGLTYWTPNVNLFRDPRWGRGQETYGEDPHLLAEIGKAFVRGVQGDGDYLMGAALAKHYAVHSGPEKLRHTFDAKVSRFDLWNTYLPAFEALVTDAKVEGVMGAYNRTNGAPCCAHPYLISEVLRGKWQFKGYFVSDCWALVDFYQGHNVSEDAVQAAALALNSGCNLNCGSTYPNLGESLAQELITEEQIDQNLRQLLPTRFRLGLFNQAKDRVYTDIGLDVVRHTDHIALSYEAALKSLVLLKNEDNVLPLDPDLNSVFVTGPMAANVQALLANYYGVSGDLVTLLEGIVDNVSSRTAIRYVQGNLMDRPNINPMDWYSDEARIADVTIACMGISQLLEGEEGEAIASPHAGDRVNIGLPEHQIEFLKLLRSKANKLVVVITGGSAISIPEVHEMADAVLYAWYPGEQGGQAVGDVLFGRKAPSGKLPVSFVKTIEDLPPYESYDMTGRTYRYAEQELLYPFGFGLSYGAASIKILEHTEKRISQRTPLKALVMVRNSGEIPVEEVLQVYKEPVDADKKYAKYDLIHFERVRLEPHEYKEIEISIPVSDFYYYDEDGNKECQHNDFQVYIGFSTPHQRALELGAIRPQSIDIKVR